MKMDDAVKCSMKPQHWVQLRGKQGRIEEGREKRGGRGEDIQEKNRS